MTEEYNRSKVGDFFIGFGISIGLSMISWVLSIIPYLIGTSYSVTEIMTIAISIFIFIAYVGLIVLFFVKKLTWIAIGMLSTLVIIPLLLLLLFGACLLVFVGAGGF